MPEVGLKLRPSVNVEVTPTLNEAGISACNLIRFKAALPQKLGGWEKYYPFSVLGISKDVHPWQDLNATKYLAVGSTQQLAVISEGELRDITPQTFTSDIAPSISTTASSTTVEITDTNIANVTTFDAVFFNTPVSVGGIILSGLYQIINVTGASSYQITAATAAASTVSGSGAVPQFDVTSGSSEVDVTLADHGVAVGDRVVFAIATTLGGITVEGTYSVISVGSSSVFTISGNAVATSTTSADMNGGDAQLVYYIALGPQATGVGYGLGGYGLGGYGTGVVPSAQTGTPITATGWTIDNWGEILLASPSGGAIYYWSPTGGFSNASIVSGGPVFNGGIFVAMPQQILVAWGSAIQETIGVRQDPLLVSWSDSENFLDWTPTSANMAGSFHIPTGSKIVGGLQGPQQALIWTDIDVYGMSYIGTPLVFGFNKLSSGCGLIGAHAACVLRGVVYWMNQGNFFQMSGNGISQLPCSVWDVVYQDIDTDNQHKCIAAPNSSFDEVTFYYPSLSGGTGENDKYVKLNVVEGTWDYGTLARSAWSDQSVLGEPIGTLPSGTIYQHETSTDADGQPLVSWFETGWFVIAEGRDFAFVDWLFPDMKFGTFGGSQSAAVQMTITAADYPNGNERVYGPFTMTEAKTYINLRLRGRMIKIKVQSSDLGSFWRLGLPRYRIAPDGRR